MDFVRLYLQEREIGIFDMNDETMGALWDICALISEADQDDTCLKASVNAIGDEYTHEGLIFRWGRLEQFECYSCCSC